MKSYLSNVEIYAVFNVEEIIVNIEWKKKLENIARKTPQEHKAHKAYSALWKWMVTEDYNGACHDTSVMLYMLFSEIGLKCTLCIGEVKLLTGAVTDHSWVEVEGKIYDIAISLPNFPDHYHAPIYNGISLENNGLITALYGIYEAGLDVEAESILNSTISEYLTIHPWGENFCYKKVNQIAKSIALRTNTTALKTRYGMIKRSHIVPNNVY